MKERPILFSTPMVRAILDGRKTQTRRVVKPQPQKVVEECRSDGTVQVLVDSGAKMARRPYHTGDVLWVREAWGEKDDFYYYKAKLDFDFDSVIEKWRPSIHMPREAARLFLEVKAVRVERLHDITNEDAKAEGISRKYKNCLASDKGLGGPCRLNCPADCSCLSPRELFFDLWDNLYAKRDYSWESDPWVWVVEFERKEHLPSLFRRAGC